MDQLPQDTHSCEEMVPLQLHGEQASSRVSPWPPGVHGVKSSEVGVVQKGLSTDLLINSSFV